MGFTEILANEFKENTFDLFKRDLMLLTAEKDEKTNTMTIGWGGLGVMWGKNVAFVVVRPERYTNELLKDTEKFSLSAFSDKNILSYCGSVSGRNEDKIKKLGLTVLHEEKTPYFEEARLNILCKKLFSSPFKKEDFTAGDSIINKWYAESNYHILYIAEIEKILVK